MNPRNVSASVVESDGGLKVWGVSFSLPGNLHRDANGKIDEKSRKAFQKKVEKFLSQVDFSALMLSHGIR